jgi:predicted translin family RNA/ssDNA-binding protein
MNNIDMAIDKLSDRHGLDALNFQHEALYDLNRAAVRMLDALESQNNCNKGGACNKPTMKLNSLCNQQKNLNEQTQSQCQNPNQQDPSSREALRRLASEQGTIQKSLQELEQEFGGSREILGRLDAIGEDMQKVVDALTNGEVGQETLERQLRIYSRMLDATKTMQRKDFTDQRKANVGEDVLRNSPPALTGNQLQGGLDIDDQLRRFMNESYPREYEQQIKAYFKALIEQMDSQTPSDYETD